MGSDKKHNKNIFIGYYRLGKGYLFPSKHHPVKIWEYSLHELLKKREKNPLKGESVYYRDIVVEGEEPPIPRESIEEIKRQYHDMDFHHQENSFFHVIKKGSKLKNGELRIYLDVKQPYRLEIQKRIIDKIKHLDSFHSSKIYYKGRNRDDSLLIYLSGNATKAEIETVMDCLDEIVEEYAKKGVMPFENHETHHPFGVGIYTSKSFYEKKLGPSNMRIGTLVYHPIHSGMEGLPVRAPDGFSVSATSPNELYHAALEIIADKNTDGKLSLEEFLQYTSVDFLDNPLITNDTFRKFIKKKLGKSSGNLSLKEFTAVLHEYLDEIIPDNYKLY